jgi:hypothetical protein
LFFDFLRLPPVYAGDGDCDGGIASGTTTPLFLLELTTGGGTGGALALCTTFPAGTAAFPAGTAGFANKEPILL